VRESFEAAGTLSAIRQWSREGWCCLLMGKYSEGSNLVRR
jgi:hypothetical protein